MKSVEKAKFSLLPSLKARTILENIDVSKSTVMYRTFDEGSQPLKIRALRSLCEGSSRVFRELYGIEWMNGTSLRSRLRLRSEWSRGTRLPGRKSVVLIITYDIDEIDIATTGMEKMSKPNTISVSISSDYYDREFWVRELHSGCERKRTTMEGLSGIPIDILRCFPRTTNSRDNDTIMTRDPEILKSVFNRHKDEKISTARTPLDFIYFMSHIMYNI
jgi:hypothetical protein